MGDGVTTLGAKRVEEAVKSLGKLLSPSVPGLRPPQPCALRADVDAFRLHNHNLAYLDPLINLCLAFRSLVLALLQLLTGTNVLPWGFRLSVCRAISRALPFIPLTSSPTLMSHKSFISLSYLPAC
jgi:hypothetical protein